jgi:hypothetical protein
MTFQYTARVLAGHNLPDRPYQVVSFKDAKAWETKAAKSTSSM